MPRAFDITASSNALQVDASGQAEVTFTVSNALRRLTRVRAIAEPSGGARSEWVSFPEGAERDLPPDGTAVIPVRISVPQGTPPGSYGFDIVVSSVSNPDEHYARSPPVAFTVKKAPEPEKKAFPWWLVALIGGGVLIVGGVVAILLLRDGEEPASLGQECTPEVGCLQPLVCHEGLCLIPNGRPCTHSSQCVSGNCADNECKPPVRTCPGECPPGQVCINGRCQFRILQIDPEVLRDLRIRQPIERINPPSP